MHKQQNQKRAISKNTCHKNSIEGPPCIAARHQHSKRRRYRFSQTKCVAVCAYSHARLSPTVKAYAGPLLAAAPAGWNGARRPATLLSA